jgi:hypothetical protein
MSGDLRDIEKRLAALETLVSKLPRHVPMGGGGIRIIVADVFPVIAANMAFTFLLMEEEDIGWTLWHARGGDTIWAQVRWSEQTGEPGTGPGA